MKRHRSKKAAQGFTLIELMTALGIFLLICGAAFTLLATSQKRYQTESQVLNVMQEARFGIDQMVRDINDAGFPPQSFFTNPPSDLSQWTAAPFAWSPGYPATNCQLGISCGPPGDMDLIIETNLNPVKSGGNVQWVRYQLSDGSSTLMRGVVDKPSALTDPVSGVDWTSAMVPFVQNVVNNASSADIANYKAVYPSMFPSGVPVPIFTYSCDTATGPVSCGSAGSGNNAANIRDITVTLIVQTPSPDATTGAPRLVAISGRGHRVNPNQ